MPQLAGSVLVLALIAFVGYVLIAGAIIIWPIFNILAYLKVLIFPRPIRKKYGTDLNILTKKSFDIAITETDHKEIKNLKSSIQNLKDELAKLVGSIDKKILVIKEKISKLNSEITSLGKLKKNNDGSFSQRSSDGKLAYSLNKKIVNLAYDKSELEYEIDRAKDNTDYEIDVIKDSIKMIKNKPWLEWDQWSSRYARYLSNKNAIIFMFFGFPIFFSILAYIDFLTFAEVLHLYTYISYIQPIADIFGLENFNPRFSSNFLSFEYAASSVEKHSGEFSFGSWILYTLTMPLITFIVFYFSYKRKIKDARKVEPSIF